MSEPFKMAPGIKGQIKRTAIAKKAAAEVARRIDTLVEKLRKKHPQQDKVICRHLEAAADQIRSENAALIRKAREVLIHKAREAEKEED